MDRTREQRSTAREQVTAQGHQPGVSHGSPAAGASAPCHAAPPSAESQRAEITAHRALMARLGLSAEKGDPKPIGHRYDLRGLRWDSYEWPDTGRVVEAGPFRER